MFGKKKEKLFGNHVDVNCEYCSNSSECDGANICRLNRCPEPDGSCSRFSYDPLKRSPKNLPPMPKHDADEFQL